MKNQQLNNLRSEVYSKNTTPKGRLKALISVFAHWSEDAEKQKLMREIAVKMDFHDIDFLRNMIDEQVLKLKVKKTNDLTDQILFIIIGALKFEINRDAFSKHWQLRSGSERQSKNRLVLFP